MSVNPLDLQTNFSQMGNVGKQQSLLKESEVLRQEEASELIDKNSEKDADDIPETKDLSEGYEKIKERERRERRKRKQEEKNNKKDKELLDEDMDEVTKQENKQLLKDPNLGQNIDIIG